MYVQVDQKQNHTYLEFTIKALNLVNMWPKENRSWKFIARQYFLIVIIIITTFPILADFVVQLYDDDNATFQTLNENIVALSALYGVIYISICFLQNQDDIKTLVEDLSIFEEYSPQPLIMEIEESTKFYTKLFIIYGIIGNIIYGMMPFLNYQDCQRNKLPHMIKYGIPCGSVVRFLLPFKMDYFPATQIEILEEIVVCTLGTTIIMMITMLVCGILIHITGHLKHLKVLILELSTATDEELHDKVKFCLKFHTLLVNYASRADTSLQQMMLLHITWTGFIISVLGFEIIMVTNYVEILRFAMHLAGWLGMLFIVCYYGQALMDESNNISDTIYSVTWYEKPVYIQKYIILILLRSQRPLTLKAAKMKVMSLQTFIGVLYSAYSYFTLLLKLKPSDS